jgi:hypothetical protein
MVLFTFTFAKLIRSLLVRGCLTPMVISPRIPTMRPRRRVLNGGMESLYRVKVFAYARYGYVEVCNF